MPVVPADVMMTLSMDYDSLGKAGTMLGAGSVIVMDETVCMVRALMRLSYFYLKNLAVSVRLVGKARAGCIALSSA